MFFKKFYNFIVSSIRLKLKKKQCITCTYKTKRESIYIEKNEKYKTLLNLTFDIFGNKKCTILVDQVFRNYLAKLTQNIINRWTVN